MQYPQNCGKTVGNNPAEQGTIPHFCFENKEKHPKSHDFECIFGCGGGVCWPCQKHSRLGHLAQLVPDTPCFFSCRTRCTVHRTRSHSKPTPSSGGRGGGQFHLSVETKENRPNRVCFFCLASQTKKDITLIIKIHRMISYLSAKFLTLCINHE